jgi:NAD(P)-dependent dehydrogenase (short-subunit alcohol dehydrogenase family)
LIAITRLDRGDARHLGLVAYTASKHAVVGLTRTGAIELIRDGIRVNAVCPAPIETPLADELHTAFKGRDPAAVREVSA